MTQNIVPSVENVLSSSRPRAASKVAGRIRLVVYPGEFTTVTGVTLGHIYVLNGSEEKYEIAGGLPPDPKRGRGADGHYADATPTGKFVLSAAEHHVTQNWPASVIPWGAPLSLGNSHGCIHIRPSHRDEMMKKGYLKAGIEIEVKPYGQKGPP